MRLENWHRALDDVLQAASGRPFVWGEWDCCLFAADIMAALTGYDPAAHVRGTYSTATGAVRVLKRHFAGDVESTWTAICGAPIPPGMARRGDLVGVPDDCGAGLNLALGVVDLSGRRLALLTTKGLHRLPRSAATIAWRIG